MNVVIWLSYGCLLVFSIFLGLSTFFRGMLSSCYIILSFFICLIARPRSRSFSTLKLRFIWLVFRASTWLSSTIPQLLTSDLLSSITQCSTFHWLFRPSQSPSAEPLHPRQAHLYQVCLAYSHKTSKLPVTQLSAHFSIPFIMPTSLDFLSSFCSIFPDDDSSLRSALQDAFSTTLEHHSLDLKQIVYEKGS